MSKSVLVTGASGFIGRETVTSLEQAGWTVTQGLRNTAQPLKSFEIYLDLHNLSEILALENRFRFDAIVHLGAHVGLYGSTSSRMFVPNILATGCLAHLASRWNAKLVFASTAIVCGVRSERIDVNTTISADTPYALTKLLGEQLIEASCIPHCILRIGGVFGPNGPVHLGLNRAIENARKNIRPTQIGTGNALRNYVYVKDVAVAIKFALEHNIQGIHYLAGIEVMSINTMLKAICEIFLPSQLPVIADGEDSISQVIEPSTFLPKPRGFRDALIDIKGMYL